MIALGRPVFKQLHDNVIQYKRFSSFTKKLSDNLLLSIAYNSVKILINALSFPVKIISEVFLLNCLSLQENRRLRIKNSIEN